MVRLLFIFVGAGKDDTGRSLNGRGGESQDASDHGAFDQQTVMQTNTCRTCRWVEIKEVCTTGDLSS